MDILAHKLGMDPAELRMKNFIRREQFPYQSALGWEYDSGDYHVAMRKAMDTLGYAQLRQEQKAKQEAFKRGETREIMGIGVSFFTEIVGAGPSKNCDILGVAMFDSGRDPHPSNRFDPCPDGFEKPRTRPRNDLGSRSSLPSWAIPADDIMIEEGNTDTAPYGLGTYGSRSTPVAGAAIAMAARKIKAKAQMIAAHLLEVSEYDLEWDIDGFRVKGNPERAKTMKESPGQPQCTSAWSSLGLEAVNYYDPPNMTYPSAPTSASWTSTLTPASPRPGVSMRSTIANAHQSDDHRGAGAWRPDGSVRHRDGTGDRIRRSRQCHGRLVHGLLPADRRGNAPVGDRLYRHPVAPSPDWRERRRRESECGRRAMLLQCGERCLRLPRRDQSSDAALSVSLVADSAFARPLEHDPENMSSGFYPMGGNRFTEKTASTKELERDVDST